MAVKIKEEIGCKLCWICDREVDEVAILIPLGNAIVALHPYCAKKLSIELLKDLSVLAGLGYEIECEGYANSR